jgi:membrane protein DedA with SNARE-associated domain
MLVAGAARLGWAPFMVWQLVGRLLWVAGYMALGWGLSDHLVRLATTGG